MRLDELIGIMLIISGNFMIISAYFEMKESLEYCYVEIAHLCSGRMAVNN